MFYHNPNCCRKAHWLSCNSKTVVPSSLLFFDTETNIAESGFRNRTKTHTLRLGVARYVRRESHVTRNDNDYRFAGREEFWQYVYSHTSRHRPLYCFSHNIGFDLGIVGFGREVLQNRICLSAGGCGAIAVQKGDTKLRKNSRNIVCFESPPTIIECSHNGKKIVFLDTMNYWQCSLKKLGQAIGLHKWPMPSFDLSNEAWYRYCQRDVGIIAKAILGLLDWIELEDLGHFAFTAVGQAWNAYRHRFMKRGIHLHGHTKSICLERKAYRGGRSSCFYHGRVATHLYHLDINGLFANVMRDNAFPCRLRSAEVSPALDDVRQKSQRCCSVARVMLDTKQHEYPKKTVDGIVYARGKFITELAGPELSQALRCNEVKFVEEIVHYERGCLFTDFVSHFWGSRQRFTLLGEEVKAELCKLMVNGLYGKFAQKANYWKDSENPYICGHNTQWPEINAQTGIITWLRSICGNIQEKVVGEDGYDSFPAIAAYVTSYARLVMDRFRAIAGPRNVYYQYIDAIIVNRDGYCALLASGCIDSRQIGKLKLEGESNGAYFYGQGRYMWNGTEKICGIPRTAVKLSGGRRRFDEWPGAESIATGDRSDCVLVQSVERVLTDQSDNIIADCDGWVKPIVLTEW